MSNDPIEAVREELGEEAAAILSDHVALEAAMRDHFYSADELLVMAKPVTNGYSFVRIQLRKGDSAYAPGTTKYVLHGVGEVEYMIHPTGWNCLFFGDVYRSRVS